METNIDLYAIRACRQFGQNLEEQSREARQRQSGIKQKNKANNTRIFKIVTAKYNEHLLRPLKPPPKDSMRKLIRNIKKEISYFPAAHSC